MAFKVGQSNAETYYIGNSSVDKIYLGNTEIFTTTSGPTIPTTNLVLWLDPTDTNSYPGSGTTITNLGSGPNASLINGAGFNASGYWTLDGTNDYIQSTDNGSYDISTSSDFTLIVWVRVTTSNDYAHFFSWDLQSTAAFKAAPSAYSYEIYWYTPSYSTYGNFTPIFNYSMSSWFQLAMIRRSGTWEAYKNGSFVASHAASDTAGFSCTNLNMGYGWTGEFTAQSRGPMLFYNGTALTSQQITDNYDYYKTTYGLS